MRQFFLFRKLLSPLLQIGQANVNTVNLFRVLKIVRSVHFLWAKAIDVPVDDIISGGLNVVVNIVVGEEQLLIACRLKIPRS